MKKTLGAAAIALLTLTSCGGEDQAAPVETTTPDIQTAEAEPTLNTTLEPNPDGHEIHIMFQWIPEEPDSQPVEARYYMNTSEAGDTGVAYVTPALEYDAMPSMDTGQWETYVYDVPDGGHASGSGHVQEYPAPGRATCLAVEMKQEVILDYQESLVGEDEVSCYAFTDDDHDYTPGEPPVGVELY